MHTIGFLKAFYAVKKIWFTGEPIAKAKILICNGIFVSIQKLNRRESDMQDEQASSIKPHIIIISVIIIVVAVVFLWPSNNNDTAETSSQTNPVESTDINSADTNIAEIDSPTTEPELFEVPPIPETVELKPEPSIEPLPESQVEAPEPEPIDVSDAAIESALVAISKSELITDLLVSDALLQRFVVTVTNLANNEMAPNHRLVTPPEQTFRVYQQANRYWIDPASYKRYTPYINALEKMENEQLLNLFNRYKPQITEAYEEISSSRQTFETTLLDAIDTLLNTPEIPMPVEVYTDSVAFKYKDEQLEELNAPQKQLLRTGPDNMRRIKAKLRELKTLVENQQ